MFGLKKGKGKRDKRIRIKICKTKEKENIFLTQTFCLVAASQEKRKEKGNIFLMYDRKPRNKEKRNEKISFV